MPLSTAGSRGPTTMVHEAIGEWCADSARSARAPVGDFRQLYCCLTRQDDEPAHLLAAERRLLLRLKSLEGAARQRAADRAAALAASSAEASAGLQVAGPDCSLWSAAVADWLAAESVVLQRVAQAATGEDPVHLLLFRIYRRWQAAAVVPHRDAERGVDAHRDMDFEPAVVRHALSCSPKGRLPEIMGYLGAALVRLVDLVTTTKNSASSRETPELPPSASSSAIGALIRERPAVEAAQTLWLDTFYPHAPDRVAALERLALGEVLHESLWRQVVASERRRQQRVDDPVAAFVQGLRRKAGYAAGYHSGIELAGRGLDDWFAEDPFDAGAFLRALADSPWVDRVQPERSPLLRLLEFGGPMFGIFSDAETDGLRAWLHLQSRSVKADRSSMPSEPPLLAAARTGAIDERSLAQHRDRERQSRAVSGPRGSAESGNASKKGAGRSIHRRNLFHRLLQVESDPSVLVPARSYAEDCLAAAGRGVWPRPFPYRAGTFTAWVEARYRTQLRGFKKPEPGVVPRLSHAAYRFGIEQLAPAVLVDGCWLQRAVQLHAVSPEVAERLLMIHAEELGDGMMEHNHPHLYRRLLESLGIELPPLASPDFARCPRFLDAAFDLPTFLLSISLSPHRFLPELLGLNLAIELSGLGAAYSRVARELEHWGIDATIVRLHQSIDNLASGHAALARDCVMIHLDQMRALGGEPAVQQHWIRIWNGYRSLATVTRRFRWQLVARYGVRVGRDWLSRVALLGRRKNAFSGAG